MYIRLAFVASHICEIPRNSPKIRTYSRSPKVIDLGVNGKRICDFLLVINSNYGHIPYILAYKSQNLRQNLDLKVGGATYKRVIK